MKDGWIFPQLEQNLYAINPLYKLGIYSHENVFFGATTRGMIGIYSELRDIDSIAQSYQQSGQRLQSVSDYSRVLQINRYCIRGSIGFRKRPVWELSISATASGVPVAMISPPPSPPSGPRSTIQSAVLITSRLCSITTTVLP